MSTHIWTIQKWHEYYDDSHRSGLRFVIQKGVDDEVRRACKEFGVWLRREYYFPKRVPVYVKNSKRIKARDGDMCTGIFWGSEDRDDEPYIRAAAGDYYELLEKWGKDNALGAILGTIAHELMHYFQWINNIKLTPIGEERQATRYQGFIIDEYAETREHP